MNRAIRNIFIILFLVVLPSLKSFAAIYETTSNGNWNSSSIWSPSKPSMSWGSTDTVYIKHYVTLNSNIVIHGIFKIIATGQLLGTSKNITVKSDGRFANDGIVSVKSLSMDWDHLGGENNGTITLAHNFINREGTFANNGTMTVGNTFNNSYDGIFSNDGTLNVSGNFKNYDSFTSTGDINVDGNFTNLDDGEMNISGDVDVEGNFKNKGAATMDGEISVDGNFINDWSATFSSSNELSVDGDITNKGPFTNSGDLLCDNFINKDEITNSGDVTIAGDFTNQWSDCDLANSGNITIEGDAINNGDVTNDDGSMIWVKGEVDNDGNVINDGDIYIDNGLIGTGDVVGVGSLCHSDGVTNPNNSKGNNVSCATCNNGSLPVQLIKFNAELVNSSSVEINWTTATEENNDFFEILSSVNGIDFEVIGKVNGNGNSNVILNYKFVDNRSNVGIIYYKLKQVDFDGKTDFSNIVYVKYNSNTNNTEMYPNPVVMGDNVNFTSNDKIDYIEFFDVSGRVVRSVSVDGNISNISTLGMKKGVYILRIVSNTDMQVKRLIIN